MNRVVAEAERLGLLRMEGSTPIFTRSFVAPYAVLDDIVAQSGFISIVGETVTGSGLLDAPGNTTVTVVNETPAFLRVNDITIPQDGGGEVKFNEAVVQGTPAAGFNFTGTINSIRHGSGTGTENAPAITIRNTYSPGPGGVPAFTRAPDIELAGISPTSTAR
jgi:hypothetical protein